MSQIMIVEPITLAGIQMAGRRLCISILLSHAIVFSTYAAGDPVEGRRMSKRWCASCHAVGPEGRGSDTAPSFAAIAQRRDVTYLQAFLSRPHPPMPRVQLSRQEIDDLIAYIEAQQLR